MADFLAIARNIDARHATAEAEPLGERVVQAISRTAGVVAFVGTLGALLYWLMA